MTNDSRKKAPSVPVKKGYIRPPNVLDEHPSGLMLELKVGQRIVLDGEIVLRVIKAKEGYARIMVGADRDIPIDTANRYLTRHAQGYYDYPDDDHEEVRDDHDRRPQAGRRPDG